MTLLKATGLPGRLAGLQHVWAQMQNSTQQRVSETRGVFMWTDPVINLQNWDLEEQLRDSK